MEEIVNSIPLEELQSKQKQKFPELSDADILTHQASNKDLLQAVGYELRKIKGEIMRIIQFLEKIFPQQPNSLTAKQPKIMTIIKLRAFSFHIQHRNTMCELYKSKPELCNLFN